MGRKCCTVFDNKSCTSGYKSDKSGFRVISFPSNIEERAKWVKNLPNALQVEDITIHMGICLKHWKKGFETKPWPGGPRPIHPPTEFGNTPTSLAIQIKSPQDRRTAERHITSEKRRLIEQEKSMKKAKEKDTISCWADLCSFCQGLTLAVQINQEEIKLIEVSDQLLIKFSVIIDSEMNVKAFCGSTPVNLQNILHTFTWKLTLYSQINNIINYLSDNYPLNLQNDMKHIGEHINKVLKESNFDEKKKKKITFLCNQLILHNFTI